MTLEFKAQLMASTFGTFECGPLVEKRTTNKIVFSFPAGFKLNRSLMESIKNFASRVEYDVSNVFFRCRRIFMTITDNTGDV